jgi:hypothetical protein
MTLDLNFQDLKQIALHGRIVKEGITLVVGRPLIPDVKTDATGTLGECGSRWTRHNFGLAGLG